MDYTQVLNRIKTTFPESILEKSQFRGELRITVANNLFVELMRFLHDDEILTYDFLTDIVGIDYLPRDPRFEVVYILFSMKYFHRLIIKLQVDEGDAVPSVVNIWKTANWLEREVYDLLGISFSGHPDLRRILTWDNFDGHPLRKDYPLKGRDFGEKFNPDTIEIT